ncbi:MAG: PAS domain-containing protein, partial [Bacteroidales bacterium]|nr:PAS domain-containing protein [Bacteroidales bacterium]
MVNEEEIGRKLSEQILNKSRSMLSVINRNYVYEKVNLRFCQTLAIDPGSVQGKSLKEIWGAENFEKNIRKRIDRCLEGETVHYQAEFDTPAGNRHYEIIFRPVHSENGNVTHLLAETFDVTREQFLEERLAQAQRLETVGLLAGGIAHDFNNILTTIYGYAELSLEEAQKNSSLYENMGRIISAVSRARSLTQQILTFSRQIDQEKVPVNPWLVLNETVTLLRSTIDDNIEIADNTSDTNTMVYADPTQLFRVFMNLLNNALQAMEIIGGTLTVSQETAVANDQIDNEDQLSGNKFY